MTAATRLLRVAAVAAVLAAAPALACTTTDTGRSGGGTAVGGPPPPGSTPAGSAPRGVAYRSMACPFPAPTVAGGASVRIDCGELTVPEAHDAPDRTSIRLAVARLSLADATPKAEPLLYLEGGPGGSALAEVALWTDPVSPLLTDRDVILVDQRGAGYSTPRLTCDPELADPATDGLSDAQLNRACHDRLTRSGIDLDAYDTVESAHDVEALRLALGIERWDLMGVSYGTRLALEAMHLHPDGIRAVVLDSVYPPGINGLDEQPTNAWAAMQAVLDDCRADDACNRAYPDLQRRFLDALERLTRQPVTVRRPAAGAASDGSDDEEVQMDGAELVHTVFDALYVSAVLPDVPKALDAAARGDLQRADDLLAGIDIPDPVGAPPTPGPDTRADEPPSDTDGLFLTVTCAEDVPLTSEASVRQASGAVPEPVRRVLVGDVLDQLEGCRSWPVPARALDPVRSAIPTLLLAGSDDPITPPRWARAAAATLATSTVVEIHGAGHGAIDAGPCAARAIVQFLAAARPSPSPGCTAERPFST